MPNAYWVVLFDDAPEMIAHRREFGAAHLEFLKRNENRIKIAGGMRPMPGAPFCGGMWIVKSCDFEEVVDIVQQDPYYNPKYRSFRILSWGKAIDKVVSL
ncbi:YciI family protein [Cognatishimia sp. SS12]|uniref:YciI family protein n=1 Tax=Cognatishimia sp. SS12 TaxID=2979465 RepID=UPI00232E5E11|nr:YciI family protein [Cognatishimia sp. SS12]MDC0736794.1 YciI family protein [Cognatishimia sp. SS12]